MAEYSLSADFAGSNMSNSAERLLPSLLLFDESYRRVTYLSRRGGVWCRTGGNVYTATIEGYDTLYDSYTGAFIKQSSTGQCVVSGAGPNQSTDYITTEFVDWTDSESKAAIAAWQAGTLQIRRSIRKLSGNGSYAPYFREGFYSDTISIQGTTIPYTDYGPRISGFSVYRSTNWEPGSEDLDGNIIHLKYMLTMGDTSNIDACTVTAYWAAEREPEISDSEAHYVLDAPATDTLGAMYDRTLNARLGTDQNWFVKLVFACGDENYVVMGTALRYAIPLHISNTNNGICFGGRSSATAESPKFESYYPAYLRGGIGMIGGTMSDAHQRLGMVYGTTENISAASGNIRGVDVFFPIQFASPPTVVAVLAPETSTANHGRVTVTVSAVGNTYCTLRFCNSSGSTLDCKANWIAIGQPG